MKRLQSFLYILLRDEIPFGVAEKILAEHVRDCDEYGFGNDDLARYTEDLAKRILK